MQAAQRAGRHRGRARSPEPFLHLHRPCLRSRSWRPSDAFHWSDAFGELTDRRFAPRQAKITKAACRGHCHCLVEVARIELGQFSGLRAHFHGSISLLPPFLPLSAPAWPWLFVRCRTKVGSRPVSSNHSLTAASGDRNSSKGRSIAQMMCVSVQSRLTIRATLAKLLTAPKGELGAIQVKVSG